MMRSAADFDTPKNRATWRIVRFVRQYAATSSARSSRDRPHGRPLWTASAPSPQHGHQLAELPRAQPGKRGYPDTSRRQAVKPGQRA